MYKHIFINFKNINNWFLGTILTTLISCNTSKKEIFSSLEEFDSSLDSLISQKTFNSRKFCLFYGDTLKYSPKKIVETYYQIIGTDSLKVEANCHIYKFKNNELIINSSEDVLGSKYINYYLYFDDKIDNRLIEELRLKNTDTIFSGSVKKYDENGFLIKEVHSGLYIVGNKNVGIKSIKKTRNLEVYSYNIEKNEYTIYRKSYFKEKYDIDSLKAVKIETIKKSIISKRDPNSEYEKTFQYKYEYDKYGNWIVKRRINDLYPEVYYRKLTY